MKITESKNLKYDHYPIEHSDGPEKMDPSKCILESFVVLAEKIDFHFQNGSTAFVSAKNVEGYAELEVLGKRMGEFLGKSYKDILDTNY
jgi:hypothetical protein